MNASDLRFLAERASALEDRTAVRVSDLRDRIAAARRRRRVVALAGVAGVVLLAISVVVVTSARNDKVPEPAPNPDTARLQPTTGTCWAVPPRSVVDYAYDGSPQVPCAEEHTTETVFVYPLDEPTAEDAMGVADRCITQVLTYVGIDERSWIPWSWNLLLPSRQQIADGASWVRCDATFPTTLFPTDAAPARTTSVSAADIADQPPATFWACLAQDLSVADQRFIPCDQPHTYEETGTFAVIHGSAEYPAKDELESEARTQCRPSVPKALTGASVTAAWDPRPYFEPGAMLAGACYAFDPSGEPLPAR